MKASDIVTTQEEDTLAFYDKNRGVGEGWSIGAIDHDNIVWLADRKYEQPVKNLLAVIYPGREFEFVY